MSENYFLNPDWTVHNKSLEENYRISLEPPTGLSERLYFPAYAKKFLRIRTKEAALQPLDLSTPRAAAQRKVWRGIWTQMQVGDPIRLIILKARQMGMSTFSEGFVFHRTITNPLAHSLVIAHDLDGTEGLFEMSKLFYEELPDDPLIKPSVKYSTRREMSFADLRSSMSVQTSNNFKAGRGGTLQYFHASEVSLWQYADELVSALFPSIPEIPESAVIFETTAHGSGNWFHDFWKASVEGKTGYLAIFLPWFMMPEYQARVTGQFIRSDEEELLSKIYTLTDEQLEWRRRQIARFESRGGSGEDTFRQEYPATWEEAFLASGLPVFSPKTVHYCSTGAKPGRRYNITKGRPVPDTNGTMEVWEEPDPTRAYTIGVDVSSGVERGDYSVISVVKNEGFKQAAECRILVDPITLAPYILNIANWYNEAIVAVEINNHGIATQRALMQDYWNIYRWQYLDSVANRYSTKLGWLTTLSTKPLMISFSNHLLQHHLCEINSPILKSEMLTFIKRGEIETGAAPNCYDDTVMAWMIAIVVAHIEEHGTTAWVTPGMEGKNRKWEPIQYEKVAREIDGKQVMVDGRANFIAPPMPFEGGPRRGKTWREIR